MQVLPIIRRLTWGTSVRKGPDLLAHAALLWCIGGHEPEKGVATAGPCGYFLTGPGAMLNQALIAYGLKFLLAHAPKDGKRSFDSLGEDLVTFGSASS